MTQPEEQQPPPGSSVPLPPGWGVTEPQPAFPPVGAQPPPFHPGGEQAPTFPTPGQAAQPAFPPLGQTPQPVKKRNLALIITAIVLGVVLVLCAIGGVGAFLLLQNSEGTGAATAKDAAAKFLSAVYKDGDAAEAEQLVCREARDAKAIAAKVDEVKEQKAKLRDPSVTWDQPKIENETTEAADTTVTVQLSTSDEKVSTQTLKLSLVQRDGWFVCEVQEQTQ